MATGALTAYIVLTSFDDIVKIVDTDQITFLTDQGQPLSKQRIVKTENNKKQKKTEKAEQKRENIMDDNFFSTTEFAAMLDSQEKKENSIMENRRKFIE